MSDLKARGLKGRSLKGRGLKGRSFSCAVNGTQIICHPEGALAPEGPAVPTGGAA